MIVRCWKGSTTAENTERYLEFLTSKLVPVFHTLHGFVRVQIMKRSTAEGFEFQIQSYWQSMNDIAQFATENISTATVPDEARALLSSFDKTVTHYEVVDLD